MPRPSFRSKFKSLLPGDKSNEKTSPRGSLRSQSNSPAPSYTSQPPRDDHGNQEAPLQDLWHAAYQQLSPVNRRSLNALEPHDRKQLPAVLDDIITQTKEKYEVRKPIREKAIGIVGAVLKFKEVADQVSSFDPTKHAAAAWGLVSIALAMIRNDGEISTATLEACLYLTDALARYAIVEQRYRASDNDSTPGFTNAIVCAYKAVLEYTVAAKVVKESGTARRMLTSLTPLTDHNLTSLKIKLAESDSILGEWLRLVEYEAQIKMARQILGKVDTIAAKVNAAEHSQILNWLSSETVSTIHTDAVESRCDGTGQWLLNHYDYKSWRDLSSGSRFLWVYGGAGLGKTVLCSTAIQNIQGLSEQDCQTKLAYWYFRFNNTSKDIISRMLRSFIRQLSASSISASVAALYDFHHGPNTDPTLDELMSVLDEIVSFLDCKVFLMIDGLDECPELGQNQNRRVVLNYVKHLLEKRYVSLRIFITSRQEPDIESSLEDVLKSPVGVGIAAENLVGPDINMYVESKITEKFHRFSKDIQTSIRDTLTKSGEKRFRWVHLQVDTLEKEGTRRNVHTILKSLPKSLEESYQRILDQRPESLREEIRTILMYLAVAYRPMTIDEIASAVDLDPEDIRRHCTSTLVTMSTDWRSNTLIKLAHFSVKEYLVIKVPPPKMWCQFTEAAAHIKISSASLSSLFKFKTKPITEEDHDKMLFILYAAQYWPRHAREAMSMSPGDSGVVKMQVSNIFCPEFSQSYLSWLRLWHWNESWRGPDFKRTMNQVPPPLYLAAQHGFSEAFHELIQNGAQIIPQVEAKYNALIPAAIYCHTEIVSEILKTIRGPTTYDVSKIFYDIGSDDKENFSTVINIILRSAFPASTSPIAVTEDIVIAAATNSYHDTTIIDCLLDQEHYRIEITEDVLIAAAQCHNNDVMRILLDQRGDEFQITNDVSAAAADSGSDSVMRLLLERRGDEIQITEDVLISAAKLDESEMLLLLMDHLGDDFHLTEDIVLGAAQSRRSSNMKLLLNRLGHQLLITHAVLLAASKSRGDEVMSLLLDQRGGDIDITEDILEAAADNMYLQSKHLELLLNQLDRQGHNIPITHNVVVAAASSNSHNSLKLLLDRRAGEVNITEDVVLAAASTSSATLELLLDRQADKIQITNEVVKKAATKRQTLGLLLDRYEDKIKITHDVVKAAAGSYEGGQVLELLLDRRGDEVQITPEIVQAAAGIINSEAINLLLDRRSADVKVTREVLTQVARRSNDSKTMERLLDKLGDDFPISEEVVIGAAGNMNTDEILRLLLYRRGDEIQITHDVMVATAGTSTRTMQLLLDQRGHEVQITQEILVEAADGSFGDDDETLKFLLNHRGSEVHITPDVLVAATQNYKNMKFVLSRRPDEIIITPDVMIASAGSWEGPGILKLLLDRQADQFQAFQDLAVEAAQSYGGESTLKFLLLNRGDHVQVTRDLLVAAASNFRSQCMELLLRYRPDEVRITPDVVMAATKGYRTMKVLLDLRSYEMQITEDLLIKIASRVDGRQTFKVLLDRRGDEVHITPDILEAVAGSYSGVPIMNLLISERTDEVQITHEILVAAVGHSSSLSMLMVLLDRRGDEIQITQDVLLAAAENVNINFMRQLLQRRGDDVQITEEVLSTALRNPSSQNMIECMLENGVPCYLTEKLLVVVVSNYDSSISSSGWKTFLHEHGKAAPLTWEGLHGSLAGRKALSALSYYVDCGQYLDMKEETSSRLINHASRELVNRVLSCKKEETFELPSSLEQAVSDCLSIEVIKLRSLSTNDAEITEAIVKEAAETLSSTITDLIPGCQGEPQPYTALMDRASRSLQENLMMCLSKVVGENQITQESLEVAVECLNSAAIKFLLEHASTIQITETILKAAARNRHDASAVINILLRYDETFCINEEVLLVALSNQGGGAKKLINSLFRLYKSYGSHLPLTEAMLKAASKLPYPKPINAILYQPLTGFDFTNEILEAIARSASEGMFQEALMHVSGSDSITTGLLEAGLSNKNWDEGLPEFFLRRIKAKKSLITEDMLMVAANNEDAWIARWNMTALLELRKDLLIPKRLLEKLIPAGDSPIKRDTLETLVALVRERGDAEVVVAINELFAGRKVNNVFLRSELRLASAKTRQNSQA